MVFESLTAVSGRDAELVFFMEDDQYLLQDFLYMAIYMRKVATSLPQCNMLSMATVSDGTFMGNDSYRTEFTTWQPKYFSDVLGFDFATWNTIVSHFDMFCLIDDSWSRSVQYISLNRVDGERFKVISSEMPRSFKTSCGIGRGVTNCGVFEGIYKALNIIKRQRDDFFPPYLEVYANIELVDNDFIGFDIMKNNRVRIDIRNQELCNNITRAKVKKILLDMKTQFSSLTM
ncbi:unnamed protein product [Leptosia nina]|uniref:Uncharacterized protein n=1 Tax=Leptosia nina TaxID=320188 RepID=A0AAV1JCE7_9NEOP